MESLRFNGDLSIDLRLSMLHWFIFSHVGGYNGIITETKAANHLV